MSERSVLTVRSVFAQTVDTLSLCYESREALSVARILLRKILNLEPHELTLNGDQLFPDSLKTMYENYMQRLLRQEPIQYIVQEAPFAGFMFYVDRRVLIPRPETEELVYWIRETYNLRKTESLKMLDVGTGSGCIAIALARFFPGAQVVGVEQSEGALQVAHINATRLNVLIPVQWIHADIFKESLGRFDKQFDVIVSNPPYIPTHEKEQLSARVREFEPSSALFVPDDDPICYYKKIADLAQTWLRPDGNLFFELHDTTGKDVEKYVSKNGFDCELRSDLNDKTRMLRAVKKV